ncbi:MAG: right-handed parallel beta-helix repeat-containing protein, partial [Candidatus Heimdallarchaeota archaeon]
MVKLYQWLNKLLIIYFILGLSISISFNSAITLLDTTNQRNPRLPDLNQVRVIVIGSNDEFNAAAQTNNWSGNGTSSTPYRIVDIEFSSDTPAVSLIISNTDVYFELFRNSFKGDYTSSSAIVLTNVQNAVIDTSYIKNFQTGIVVSNSNNIRISNNTVSKNSNNGIETFGSKNIVIEPEALNKEGGWP